MTNLFSLPLWAPALQRVPNPLQALDGAFVHGARAVAPVPARDLRHKPDLACPAASARPTAEPHP